MPVRSSAALVGIMELTSLLERLKPLDRNHRPIGGGFEFDGSLADSLGSQRNCVESSVTICREWRADRAPSSHRLACRIRLSCVVSCGMIRNSHAGCVVQLAGCHGPSVSGTTSCCSSSTASMAFLI
jgi:hypothetical protein